MDLGGFETTIDNNEDHRDALRVADLISDDEDENGADQIPEGDHKRQIEKKFRDRVRSYKKKAMKKMTLSDQLEFRDPQNVSEFT